MLLNQMLTQYQVELRILGQSRMVSAQTKAMPTATGNNLIIKGDLIRRSVVGRLDPKCEQPELRAFDYDPIADAKTEPRRDRRRRAHRAARLSRRRTAR